MNINIRLAKKTDALKIYALYKGENFLEGNEGVSYSLNNIRDYLAMKNNKIFVAQCEKKIIGFILIEYYVDYVYFHTMAVHKNYRNKGVGTLLFNVAEEDVKKNNIRIIEAMTEKSNKIVKDILKKRKYQRGKVFQYYTKIL